MKLIIDISEKKYKQIVNSYQGSKVRPKDYEIAIINGTQLPKNATNGDMIKAMFNCMVIEISKGKVYVEGIYFPFDEEWWNAPYKTESEDQNEKI